MKGLEGAGDRIRPPVPAGGFLKAGLFSCLLHILPLLLLGSGPGTRFTEAGSKVYRIALHPVVSPEDLIQKTPSERRRNPPPLNPLPANRLSVPAEIPKREEGDRLTADMKKPEEPLFHSETPKKEDVSVALPPTLLTRSPEESEEQYKHQPIVAAAPTPSPGAVPAMKETVNQGLPGGPAGGDRSVVGGPGEGPASGKGGSGPGAGVGAGFGSNPAGGNGNGSAGAGDNGSPRGEGPGDGRPVWSGNGRQALAGTGVPGSGSGSGNVGGKRKTR